MTDYTMLQVIVNNDPLISKYYDWMVKVRNYALGTARGYVIALHYYKLWLYETNRDYRKVGYDDFVAWLAYMSDKGAAHTTICHHLYAVRNFYKWLDITYHLNISNLMLVQGPKVEKTVPEYLSRQEIEDLLSAIPRETRAGKRDAAIFELMYATGMRVSEVSNLRLSNLYLDQKCARIFGKGRKERIVLLNDRVVTLMRDWLSLRATLPVKAVASDLVFVDLLIYDAVSRFSIARQLNKYAIMAGISKHVHPHMLRHTFATHMMDAGADLPSIQALMGHESIVSTERYLHVSTAHLQRQIAKFHPHGSTFGSAM